MFSMLSKSMLLMDYLVICLSKLNLLFASFIFYVRLLGSGLEVPLKHLPDMHEALGLIHFIKKKGRAKETMST